MGRGNTGIRCLLLSPVAPPDPANGDARYTSDLLAEPPADVEYITYVEALATGELVEGASLQTWRSWRRPSHALQSLGRGVLHALRRTGFLLPDPVRWWRVDGDFDIVHAHCLPVRFVGNRPPLVLTDSAGTLWYWTIGKGMDEERVITLLRREAVAARLLGYEHPSARPDRAAAVAMFVDAGRTNLEQVRGRDFGAIVCPPGVPDARRRERTDGSTLLFVGSDFWWKGGDIAIQVFDEVRKERPSARLLIVGPRDPDPCLPGVEWLGSLPRDALYEDVYPRADVFLYPTRFDCAPLVVMEALAHGIPVVAPRAFAMEEMLGAGRGGRTFAPGNIQDAAVEVLAALDQSEIGRAEVRTWFDERWSVARRNETLSSIYAKALGR